MKEGYEVLLIFLSMLGLTLGIAIPTMIISDERNYERDHNKIAEGEVSKKFIEYEKGLSSSTWYMLELDGNSEYEVSEDSYNEVEVGDYVKIYESGRVKVE